MSIKKHQLIALVSGAYRVPERERVVAFLRDPATKLTSNPFAATRAATARHVWNGRAYDWRVMGVETAGLPELLSALAALPADEQLTEEIARSGSCTASVILTTDDGRVIGVALYGKPGTPLPSFVARRPRRRMVAATQLDLFAGHC
ncbi:hypothetical protein ACXIT0_07040 [Methylorubrum extorquens]